jgi:hypothetical protein
MYPEVSMTQSRKPHRHILIRGFTAIVLFSVYTLGMLGTSALVLGASSTAALARGGGGGGGHGGGGGGHGFGGGGHGFGGHGFGGGFRGFRGGGFGYGFYDGYYDGYYPYYEDETSCYVVRQRVMTRHGWRVRRVEVCE